MNTGIEDSNADARTGELEQENRRLRANLRELETRLAALHAQLATPVREQPVTFRQWLRTFVRRWIRILDGWLFGRNR